MKEKQSPKLLTLVCSVVLVLLVVVTASITACAGPQTTTTGPIKLVFTSHEPPVSLWAKEFYGKWFSELEKRTGGKVKVEAHWGGELFPMQDAYDAVLKGNVDIGHIMQMQLPGMFTLDEIVSFVSYDTFCYKRGRVHWELIQKFPEMKKQYEKVKLLWTGYIPTSGVGTTKKKVSTLEDCKGLKVIAYGQWSAARAEALGMVPVALPPQDMMQAFQTGVIDGTFLALFSLDDWRLGDVIKNCALVPMTNPLFATVMNLNKFNSLPADVKKTMDEMIDGLVDMADEMWIRSVQSQLQTAPKKYGMTFTEVPPAEVARWVTADKPVRDKFVAELEKAGLPGKKIMDEYLRLEKKYSAKEYAPK